MLKKTPLAKIFGQAANSLLLKAELYDTKVLHLYSFPLSTGSSA